MRIDFPIDLELRDGYGNARKSFWYSPAAAVEIANGSTTAFSYVRVSGMGAVVISCATV